MSIDTSKILTCSAGDYIDSTGNCLRDYDMVGVHLQQSSLVEFSQLVPDEAEVVV